MTTTTSTLQSKRSLYIPDGALKVSDKHSTAIAYVYDNSDGEPCARVFGGKRSKPDSMYRFRDVARRDNHIIGMFSSIQKREERTRQSRKPSPRTVTLSRDMPLERDMYFTADKTLTEYAIEARKTGSIRT